MKTILPCIVLLLAAGLSSCGRDSRSAAERDYQSPNAVSTDSAAMTAPAPTALTTTEGNALPLSSPERKIIKTADLRCRVTDVFAATTNIEHLVTFSGGQIADSRMENSTEESRSLPYKSDSLKQVTSYTTTAHLNLRVPVGRLDTVLADIAAQSAFVNSRSLHLDDVTLRFLSNKLKNEAMAGNDAAQRARGLARRTREAVVSGTYTDERNDTRIDRRIENLQLTDQVTYATLTIDLYQPQRINAMVVPNIEFLMKPTLGQQALLALNNGWLLLKALFIGILQIWPLILLGFAGLVVFRRYRIRKSAKVVVSRG